MVDHERHTAWVALHPVDTRAAVDDSLLVSQKQLEHARSDRRQPKLEQKHLEMRLDERDTAD